jgi:NADH:ubiquinone oxidoreductase subunit F (NADH-binding)
MTTLAPPVATEPRLLAAWTATGRCDLAAHVAVHGPLPGRVRGDTAGSTELDHFGSTDLVLAVADAGLTGRGGGAFPTAAKIAAVRGASRRPVLVVNGLEGEPASRKDAIVLACAPHLVLDGAELTAATIGTTEVALCVAADRQELASSLTAAVAERTRDAITVTVHRVPRGYVSGEESALVQWLEKGRARPQFRSDKGVPLTMGRRAALVQNVETLAHVALIARHGPSWFRSTGSTSAPGTALVTISGAVDRPGVHEVALGTPLADIAALADPTESIAAMLVGGYGGAWVSHAHLLTPWEDVALARLGASVGAGVLVCLGSSSCGLSETAGILAYLAAQSAGQCGPCTHGLPALAHDVAALAAGSADEEVIERLQRRMAAISGRGGCRHPDGAIRLLRSTLTVFAVDVAAHGGHRPCPVAVRRWT